MTKAKDTSPVTRAARGRRLSENAARTLTEMGYENVLEYSGSKKDWKEAGLPLETGAP